ncbi:MAG: peptidoglycan recognition family protein [Eubacterium sp.]
MKIKEKIANTYNWLKGVWIKKFIVMHYSGGTIDTDENNGEYFGRERLEVSANVFVDDDSATVSVPLTATAYHCGKDYSGGKAPYWGKCTNRNSIGIEMCGIANDKVLDMRNKTIKNTINYTKKLMKKYGIPRSRVVRHYDVCGKICPAPFVNHPLAWDCFKLNLLTSYKVRTTTAGVKVRAKINGKPSSQLKKGKIVTIVRTYYQDGQLWGKLLKVLSFV